MRKIAKHIYISIIFLLLGLMAVSQNWTWLKRGPGSNASGIKGEAIALDRLRNHIVITSIDSLNYGYGSPPVAFYISKYDNLGNLLWQKECRGTKFGHDIETDSRGNIYFLSERFNFFENQPVSITTPFCLGKLDPNGKLLWTAPVSAVHRGLLHEMVTYKPMMEIDQNDNLYFAAAFYTENFQFLDSSYTYPAVSGGDVFVAKFDTAGRVRWSRRFVVSSGSNSRYGGPLDIDVNQTGKLAVAGFFDATVDINGQVLTGVTGGSNPTGRTPFITVMDAATGNNVFAKRFTSTYTNNFITGIILKDDGSTVSCAKARGGVFMIASGTVLWGGVDMFFTSSTGTDNTNFKQMSGANNYHYLDFDEDISGNIFASLHVAWAGNSNINDSFNVRVQKYDPAGNYLYQSNINTLNKFWYSYAHIKIRDSLVAVTGSVVPRYGDIREGNNIITGGPDTIFSFVGSIGQKNNLVTGMVFYDTNGNGLQEPAEPGLPNRIVTGQPGSHYSFTMTNGNYRLFTDSGTYAVSLPNVPRYHTITPASHTVNFNGYGLRTDGLNFALRQIPGINDLAIYLSPFHIPRPGFPSYYVLSYLNSGTSVLSGSYGFRFTSNLNFLSSDSSTLFINADSAAWSFVNLQPGQIRHNIVRCQVKPTIPIGTVLNQATYIYPVAGDTIPADNIDSLRMVVRGSYDPNDKLVNPGEPIHIDTARGGKQFLAYTIRFQNTGTDTAFQVRITDSLSAKLDLNTFELITSSHPCQLISLKPGIIEFYFQNILLPDSNVNEPRSHGYLKFRIKPITTVALTDSVYNFADIYFDYNSPVRTNTTSTGFKTTVITGISNPPLNTTDLRIFPNPASEWFFYQLVRSPREVLALRIYDLGGRILFRSDIRGNGNTLTGKLVTDKYSSGTYFMELSGTKTRYVKEFIIQ